MEITYYIYATTDGNGGGFGPSQVWSSKDFVNWSLDDMNWPTTHHYWAPDVTQAQDGKYYMYYCQPVEIFGASSTTPVGPWTPLLPVGQPVVKNFLVPNVITLDGQTFKDDDGKMYMFWGTWGIYPNHGCGVGLLNDDMKSFSKLTQIPNTVAKDFFEAPFMFKRNGLYYLTYSSGRCEDDTYRVQYAVSKDGPMGPFVYGKNNPILTTNGDGSVHGPGHQSVLQEKKDFYLIYHRHNNPHSGGGYHRQVAADKLRFDAEGNIEKSVPSHEGIGFLGKEVNPTPDLAFNSKVTVSSSYSSDFKPEFAVDHNNGTLWKPKDNRSESWLSIDLGSVKSVKNVQTQFEYATWYYQYLIESSLDGKTWSIFSDKRTNTTYGSPMIDVGDVKARFIRITILNTEYPGLNKAIWNIRVFGKDSYHPVSNIAAKKPSTLTAIKPLGLLVDLDASNLKIGSSIAKWENNGKLGGQFVAEGNLQPGVELLNGRKAIFLSGKNSLVSTVKAPESMLGNGGFTVAAWVYNDSIEDEEPILSWTERGGVDLTNASLGFGSNKRFGAAAHWGWPDMAYDKLPKVGSWHHLVLTFDGTTEKLYVDGVLDHEELKMLFIANLKSFIIGSNGDNSAFFFGAISSLKVYDNALTEDEVVSQSKEVNKSDIAVYLNAARLDYGPLNSWKNEGSLTGQLALNNNDLTIADYAGKIAVMFKGSALRDFNEQLDKLILGFKGKAYSSIGTVIAEKFKDNKWHQVINVIDADGIVTYLDGLLISTKDYDHVLGADHKLKALSSFIVYDHELNSSEVGNLFSTWKETLPKQLTKATFAEQPMAVSPGLVQMLAGKVQLPGTLLQYQYSSKDDRGVTMNSGWTNTAHHTDFNTLHDHNYEYFLKVRDNFGNVTLMSDAFKISTNTALFNTLKGGFEKENDFLKNPVGAMWDGVSGKGDLLSSKDSVLSIVSSDSKMDGSGKDGPFLFKTISGDFVAEVMVSDVSGLKEKKANGANDVGLMISAADGSNNLIQNSIFPGWGVGNLVTNLNKEGRFQNNNAAAWKYYPYLQIQRQGKTFYLRASNNGRQWINLPGSPINRNDLAEKVKIGLFQATYGENSGFDKFRDFKIITRKP